MVFATAGLRPAGQWILNCGFRDEACPRDFVRIGRLNYAEASPFLERHWIAYRFAHETVLQISDPQVT